MLKLTRKNNESIYIYPNYEKVSSSTTLAELFGEDGCITVTVDNASHNKVKLSIDAMKEMAIVRSEVEEKYKEVS